MEFTVNSELTFPSDANVAGNVHGGEIMKRIDKAGWIAAARHARKGLKAPPLVTARLSSMDFLLPAHVGNVLNLTAWVTFSSRRSVEVRVEVRAENWSDGPLHGGRVTNVATMVYVVPPGWDAAAEVPPVSFPLGGAAPPHAEAAAEGFDEEAFLAQSGEAPAGDWAPGVDGASAEAKWKLDRKARRAWLAGRRQYLATKAARATDAATPPESPRGSIGMLEAAFPPELRVRPGETSGVRITTLTHVCLTEDSFQPHRAVPLGQPIFGGVILKLIDNCAGIAAFRHTRTNVVTASIEDTNLVAPVVVGNLVTARATVVFTSSRSIEIACAVVAESAREGRCHIVARATLVFISLSDEGKVLPVQQIDEPAEGTRERRLFDQAKARYNARRAARQAKN